MRPIRAGLCYMIHSQKLFSHIDIFISHVNNLRMDEDSISIKNSGHLAEKLCLEELTPYSLEELKSRKLLLEREIARTEAQIAFAQDHKNAADKLFK